jgi:hypothetical protein
LRRWASFFSCSWANRWSWPGIKIKTASADLAIRGGSVPGHQRQATSDLRFANQTLRMIVRTSIGGNKVRVRFSNAYGTGLSQEP